jgi:AraC-like DNA-binding protein
MAYLELLPDPRLSSMVECYWAISSSHEETTDFRTILPDGCTDIIFNFGSTLLSRTNNTVEENTLRAFIVGNMTKPVQSRAAQHQDLFAIRFRPGGLYALINEPLDEFTDARVDLQQFPALRNWFEQLQQTDLLTKRYQVLESLLLRHIKPLSMRGIAMSIRKFHQQPGDIRIGDLSRELGISQKQLERQFKTVVGLTPKQMARVIQFRQMVSLLRSKGEDSLLQLAVDGGYSDHAHFTKSFKEFSGITPQQFLHGQ